jgi:hypothetical protein
MQFSKTFACSQLSFYGFQAGFLRRISTYSVRANEGVDIECVRVRWILHTSWSPKCSLFLCSSLFQCFPPRTWKLLLVQLEGKSCLCIGCLATTHQNVEKSWYTSQMIHHKVEISPSWWAIALAMNSQVQVLGNQVKRTHSCNNYYCHSRVKVWKHPRHMQCDFHNSYSNVDTKWGKSLLLWQL